MRVAPAVKLAASLAAVAVSGACGPRPTPLPEETTNTCIDARLPPPATDSFGHPYRWLSLGKLKYLEVVLGGAAPEDALPIAVVLHGLGDRPHIASEPEPEEFPVRVLLPEAPTRFDAGHAWYPIRVRDRRPEDMAKALRQTTNELAGFLAAAEERYGSPCRPAVAGFSQGGIVAWSLAVRHPGAVSAAFPMAAWLPPEIAETALASARALPRIHMVHGDADPVVPLEGTRPIVDALAARGASIELEVAPGVAHEFSDGMKLRLARFLGEHAARCVGTSHDRATDLSRAARTGRSPRPRPASRSSRRGRG